mgnify:CR=1 FL=1
MANTNNIILKARQQGLSTIMLPIIKHVFPTLTAQQIVTVQPLTTPVASFVYDFIIETKDAKKVDIYDELERILNENNNE